MGKGRVARLMRQADRLQRDLASPGAQRNSWFQAADLPPHRTMKVNQQVNTHIGTV